VSLIRYWPTPEEVNKCIKPEAENAHDAVLLAVHQPTPLSYTIARTAERFTATEDELYEYVTSDNVPTGALVVPITGASGAGKSHLVRLLAARIRGSANADRYLVIRIPKSASLRKVVELILEPLPTKGYEEVKRAFTKALAEVDLEHAVISFRAALEIALKDLARSLRQSLSPGAQNVTPQMRERLDHAQRLPLLLNDATTREYFQSKVFPKIIRRAVGASGDVLLDAAAEQFVPEDLVLPADVNIGEAAIQVRNYYTTTIQARGGAGRVVATDVLRDVTDSATRQLFQLHEALGGMTLQDVILEIRRLLLKQDRELVVLVEDFKALTGIQEPLLNVLIQEGVRDGKAEYATMRSVIAVTDGYLVGRDTIATRAGREWTVESRLESEEQVLEHSKRLVASYLNAARWGESRLINEPSIVGGKTAFFSADDDSDEDHEILAAFGSVSGIPLFPYTSAAVDYFARSALTQGGALVFNPRAIIHNILREPLLYGRDAFLGKQFPPAAIKASPPSQDVAQWLATLRVSDEQRKRFQRLIVIWGNKPASRREIGRIPELVFNAFSLPKPPGIDQLGPLPTSPHPEKPTTLPPPPDDARLRQVRDINSALEQWVQQNTPLPQGLASQIRSAIAALLDERIDWNAERTLKRLVRPNQISIPRAGGEGNIDANAVKIAADNSDPDGRLRAELLSVLRFMAVFKREAIYDDVDDDLVRMANLVDRLLPGIVQSNRRGALAQARAAVAVLAANSRMLGVPEKGRTPLALNSFLFGSPPPIETLLEGASPAVVEWQQAQSDALRLREELTTNLLTTTGCFQGTGKKANGVDIARVVECASTDEVRPDPKDLDGLSPESRQLLAALGEARVFPKAKHVASEMKRVATGIGDALGDTLDKREISDAFKALVEALRDMGAWNTDEVGVTKDAFIRLCDDFNAAPLKEALGLVEKLSSGNQETARGVLIGRVAQLSFTPLLLAERFVSTSRQVLSSATAHARTLETQSEGVDLATLTESIRTTFQTLETDIGTLFANGEQQP
jgi:hypothetical protein